MIETLFDSCIDQFWSVLCSKQLRSSNFINLATQKMYYRNCVLIFTFMESWIAVFGIHRLFICCCRREKMFVHSDTLGGIACWINQQSISNKTYFDSTNQECFFTKKNNDYKIKQNGKGDIFTIILLIDFIKQLLKFHSGDSLATFFPYSNSHIWKKIIKKIGWTVNPPQVWCCRLICISDWLTWCEQMNLNFNAHSCILQFVVRISISAYIILRQNLWCGFCLISKHLKQKRWEKKCQKNEFSKYSYSCCLN